MIKKISLGYLRVILAFTVMFIHYGIIKSTTRLTVSPGAIAVVGFFTISGYLVYKILDGGRYGAASFKDFLIFVESRYLRIYPLYILVGVFFLLIYFFLGQRYSLFHTFFWLSLIPVGIYDFFLDWGKHLWDLGVPSGWGTPWTLTLDVIFYPAGFVLFRHKKHIEFLFLFLIVWSIAISFFHKKINLPLNDNWWAHYFFDTAPCMFLAYLGGMLAARYDYRLKLNSVFFTVLSFVILCDVFFYFGFGPFFQYLLSVIILPLLVSFLYSNGRSKHEDFLGNFTFSLYLLHVEIPDLYSRWSHWHVIACSIVISITLSIGMAIYIEGGFIERRRHAYLKRRSNTPMIYSKKYLDLLAIYALLVSSMAYFLWQMTTSYG